MVTGSPVLLPSGNIPQKTFDERVLFIPQNRYKFSTVPERLTRDDGRAALRQFDEIFGKFPFVDPGEKKDWNKTAPYAVVLAGVMSLVARPYLGLSATPLMAVTAPTRRSRQKLSRPLAVRPSDTSPRRCTSLMKRNWASTYSRSCGPVIVRF
jgi:hypothetical protein